MRLNQHSAIGIQHFPTGQLQVEEGLYSYGARFYDSALGRFISADTLIPQPGSPLAWDRYAYGLNNPSRYTDPTGHWTEDELNKSLGEDWREKFFGNDGVFYGREKLLEFLISKNTSGSETLKIVQAFFSSADLAHGFGADFSNIDALGARISLSGGSGGFVGLSGDMILNLTSGELSGFVSIEGGAAAGETATLVGGITIIKNMPSNENFRGVSKSAGLMGGCYGGISVEKFWGGAKYFQDASDLPDGSFVGIGGAVPGLTLYGSLAYSYEALRVDKAGSHWLSYRPSLTGILSDFGEVIQHDILKIP